jgi:hypothetical protein
MMKNRIQPQRLKKKIAVLYLQGDIVHAQRTMHTILPRQKELPLNVYNAKVPIIHYLRTSLLFLNRNPGDSFKRKWNFNAHVRTKQYKIIFLRGAILPSIFAKVQQFPVFWEWVRRPLKVAADN